MIETDVDAQTTILGWGAGKRLYDDDMEWLATYRMDRQGAWSVWSPRENATRFSEAEAKEEMYRQAAVRLLTR